MKVNWKVRFSNPAFWAAFIPALGLLVTNLLAVFGVQIDLQPIVQAVLKVVAALFSVLAILGIVNDPTTEGMSDSIRAMGYEKPWEDYTEDDDP